MDKKILIDLPDLESRIEILKLYMKDNAIFKNIDTRVLAIKLDGMSGADIKTLINNTLIEYMDEDKPLDFRRSRIRGKLRGNGVTTVAMIQNVAESYSNGAVAVTEYPAQYKLEIKFVGTIGIPPNMDDLTQTLRDILPAHLEWSYVFVFNTWAAASELTWGQANAFTWKQLRESDLNG